MDRKISPFVTGAFVVGCAFASLLTVAPAHAVHQCGTQHEGQSGDDHGFGTGCNGLDERDFVYGDARPDAPELARRGSHAVGVRTLDVVNPDQLDILNYSADNTDPRYDRSLTLEVWYPADLAPGDRELTTYSDVLGTGPGVPGRPITPFDFTGRAARDAGPNTAGGPYPLVIVSHGYPGSRVLMTYLTENLASKGYVVVSIDHTESTHGDKVQFEAGGFASTLLNRTLDIHFVLDEIAAMGEFGASGFLAGMVDDERTALIGYSMGGYGSLNAAGAGYSALAVGYPWAVPGGKLARLQDGNAAYLALMDSRIKAVVAFAPWGAHLGFWDADGMAGFEVPSLFIVGEQDQTAPFAGVDWLYNNAVSSDRYMLKYQSAIHEVAVNPPPPISKANYAEYMHYQEPAWDNRKLNNVNQHFITAFLGMHLDGDPEKYGPYLNLTEPVSNNSHRSNPADPSYWTGFPAYAAVGMVLTHQSPAP